MANKFGWKRPSLPMPKLFRYFPARGAMALPTVADVSEGMPAVYNQLDLGSCTANAGSALAEFVMGKIGKTMFMPSRLAIYYWNRVADGDPGQDNGSSLSTTMKTLETCGVPHENIWWYNTKKFAVKPNETVVADAAKFVMSPGLSINQDLDYMRSCIAEGWPFIFGFTVYESFEKIGSDGIMPMPAASESILGGHAVVAVGYDDNNKLFKIRNSWGDSWGAKGYFYMPYDYMTNNSYSDDFWTSHGYQTWASSKCILHNIK